MRAASRVAVGLIELESLSGEFITADPRAVDGLTLQQTFSRLVGLPVGAHALPAPQPARRTWQARRRGAAPLPSPGIETVAAELESLLDELMAEATALLAQLEGSA